MNIVIENQQAFDRIIPVEVRKMDEEYKMIINNFIMEISERNIVFEKEDAEFLKKFNLPECVHAVGGA